MAIMSEFLFTRERPGGFSFSQDKPVHIITKTPTRRESTDPAETSQPFRPEILQGYPSQVQA